MAIDNYANGQAISIIICAKLEMINFLIHNRLGTFAVATSIYQSGPRASQGQGQGQGNVLMK